MNKTEKFSGLSDENLLTLAKKWGRQSIIWRQKFAGLLPEIERRKLYEKKGCKNIFEFAAKLCGMSEQQVRLAINLDARFEDKPALKKLLVEGGLSINKLVRVASIATPENEAMLAEKIQLLPTSAINTLVRDIKFGNKNVSGEPAVSENQNGLQKPLFEPKSLYVQRLNFEFSDEVIKELNALHAKGFDMNELMLNMLQKRAKEIVQKKQEVGEEMLAKAAIKKPSRHIPIKVKNVLHEEYGTKCCVINCQKPGEETDHTKRFAMSPDHDPRDMRRFCKDHHKISHTIDVSYQRARERALTADE